MNYPARLRELGCEPPSERPDRDVEAIEAEIGVPLPASYREFLAECGGWWRDLCCPSQEPTPFGEHVITGFHDAAEVRGLLDSMITPRNMVTIGYGHFGAFTCLSVAGIDRGSVYALDSEFRVFWSDEEFHQRFNAMADSIREYLELRRSDSLPEKPAGYDSLYLLADDFDEFLSLCRSCSEDG
jgi:SMI1-KNR4 cell-wall